MNEVQHAVLTQTGEHILRTLVYYDIFNYPLKREEVLRFLGTNGVAAQDVDHELRVLKQHQYLYQFGEFYSIQNNSAHITRRINGNSQAMRGLALAKRKAQFIAKFPFVRAVLASGSLSKDYMDETSDLDFFIVTAPGRLWIARTLLVAYKRIFLGNVHKFFCVNYFVDEDHLEIEEKNLFTATELATAVPLYGAQLYRRLHDSNRWLKKFFPNYTPRGTDNVAESRVCGIKKVCETLINLTAAARLERHFQKITLDRWRRLYQHTHSASDFQVAFKSKPYASKNHPRNYQRSILDLYAQKLQRFGLTPVHPDAMP